MPFGSKDVNLTEEETIHKKSNRKEAFIAKRWVEQWGWLPEEYRKFQKELATTSGPIEEKIKDERTLKPIPRTSAAYVGLLAAKPEFRLEKFGPDLIPPLPMPKIYDLQTEIFKWVT